MNRADCEQNQPARNSNLLLAVASLVAATAFQIWVSLFTLATIPHNEGGRITDPGHVDAAYQGSVLAHSADNVAKVSLDPNFNAGAPTPSASDGAGRIAALLTNALGGSLTFDQYRLYVQLIPAFVPFLIAFAVRAAGGTFIAAAIAPWIAIAVWALQANQLLVVTGHCELVLAGPIVTVYLSSLYGFHRHPGLLNWFGLVVSSLIGWMIVPVPWTLVSILGAICWLLVAHRHSATWNGLAILTFIIGISPLLPPIFETMTRPDVLAQINPISLTNWLTPSSHTNASIDLFSLLPVIIALGFGIIRRCIFCAFRSSAAEWIFGCTIAGLAVGFILHHNSFISTASFNAIGLWGAFLMATPASIWLAPANTWLGTLTVIAATTVITIAAVQFPGSAIAPESAAWGLQHLTLGWSKEESTQRSHYQSVLRPTARVLWERKPDDRFSPSMIPMDFGTPILTGRDFHGDDHPWAFAQGVLGGRSISDWPDAELSQFCDRWNIGWIRTASTASQLRVKKWRKARCWNTTQSGAASMFSIERPQSYFIRGQGTVETTMPNHIVLNDVKPDGGEVVLSFSWHPGWTSAPSYVVIEPETNAFEPVPLIRLKLQLPVNRIVLRWTGR